jgi:hypothetical protein
MRSLPGKLAVCWALWVLAGTILCAQQAPPLELSPDDLVRQTVAREVAAADQTSHPHRFRSRRQTPRGSQTKLYVETKDAMAGMLIAINDQPLSAPQHQAEMDHLNWLAGNPEQLRKKRAREKEDADRTLRIVKALPDAFRYQYAGTEVCRPDLGKPGDELVRLEFTPNPRYSPPSKTEQVLEGMKGYLLIDTTAHRIALIDGTLFREVSFGWGIIGHLDKGGHFRVQQADVGDGSWEITAMSLKITGKILVFKGISMITDDSLGDFHPVPEDLTFSQGVDLLRSEHEKLAHNHEPESAAESKESH